MTEVTPVRQVCRVCQGPMLVLRATDLCRVAILIDAARQAGNPTSHRLLQIFEVTNHHWNVFGHGRMDVHRILQDGVGRVCVHELENRMNDFVTR